MNITRGNYIEYGAVYTAEGASFTFAAPSSCCKCTIFFYDKKTLNLVEKVDINKVFSVGRTYSVIIKGLDFSKLCYLYSFDGELVLDPYSKQIIGRDKFADFSREEKEFKVYSGIVKKLILEDSRPKVKPCDMVMYKAHMRGFTMHGARSASAGTYKAFLKKIPYLKSLGITSVELMPIYDFEELDIKTSCSLDSKGKPVNTVFADEKINYWGYGSALYNAPKSSYFPNKSGAYVGFAEFVLTLHQSNLELILEMSFDEKCSSDYILTTLKNYVKTFHVDGFHLIGFNVPVEEIIKEPILADTKLFFGAIENRILNDLKDEKHVFIYDDSFMYVMRQIQNHMDGSMVQLANHFKRQNLNYGFVNYAANTSGFTLYDSFSYGEKHNHLNGEDNKDGNNYNYTSNYGAEGETKNKTIILNRYANIRTALAATFLSQSIPLIVAGDECVNTAMGNNNPYCQDNEIGWTIFGKTKDKKSLESFVKYLTDFRKSHKCIRSEKAMQFSDYNHLGAPDISYHSNEPWSMSIGNEQKALGIYYLGAYADENEDVYICFNYYYDEQIMALPKLDKNKKWYLSFDSRSYNIGDGTPLDNQKNISVCGGSIVVLIGK